MTADVLFSPHSVSIDSRAHDSADLVAELVQNALASASLPASLAPTMVKSIRLREDWQEIAAASGIACYQSVNPELETFIASAVVLADPVVVNEIPGGKIRAALLFAAPPAKKTLLVKRCADAERFARDTHAAELIEGKRDARAFGDALRRWFSEMASDLCAADVMRAPFLYLTPDVSLGEVVRQMLRFNIEAIGIVDKDRRLVGEITSDVLFKMGLPDFFSQLKSVSFLGDFDPFEKYFQREITLKAADVMTTDYVAVTENTAIIEVIFGLAVQSHWKIYVVRDGHLVGIIDRMRVLQQVLIP